MIQAQSGGNSPKYGPKGLGGPIAKAVYDKVKGKSLPSMVKRETVTGTLTGSRGPVTGPRPTVGKMAPEQPSRGVPKSGPYNSSPDRMPGGAPKKSGPYNSSPDRMPGGAPKAAPKSGPYNTSPDRIDKSGKGPVPNAGKNPDRIAKGLAPKTAQEPVPGPGNRPVKPKPAPTVYRAKKGDGLWQVAEKTVPKGQSVSAWWVKIKKLNSTNGKVNRTYTGTGVKLPKA